MIPRPLAYGLIVLIALLWGADVLASILDPTHELNTTLGTAFLVVAGLLGGLSRGKPGGGDAAPPAVSADEPPPTRPVPPVRAVPPIEAEQPADPPPPGAVTAAELIARYRDEYRRGRP